MKYLITDTGFCQLLRPIGKSTKEYTLFDKVHYNMLSYKSGKWTAKLHQVLDILYNERTTTINIKDLKYSYIRPYKLKEYINYISEFEFVGLRYGITIKSPIIGFDDETVILHNRMEKVTSIPTKLYYLRYNSQFLYRHFFSQQWNGEKRTFNIQVLINYLDLRWAKNHQEDLILSYINELENANLIKYRPESSKKHLKIVKIQ